MSARDPRVKGLSLTHWLRSFEQLYGEQVARELRDRAPETTAAALRRGIDPNEWYPVAWYRDLCATGQQVTGEGVEMIIKVARRSAAAEFSGVHRLLVLFVPPQRLLRIAARLFRRYYAQGSVKTVPRGPNGAEARWVGCVGFDANLWQDCFAATIVVIEMCGGRDVQMRLIDGGGDGDEHATVLFRWT
jgi:hypothetical protein